LIRVWPFLAGLLVELASCAALHPQKMDAVPVARLDQVRHVGMAGENQFILVTGKPDSWQPRVLVRVDADASEHPLVLPTQDTACIGEALVVHGGRWMYSRCNGNGVQFVTSDAPDSPVFVANNDPALDPSEWLPFEQDDSGGVLLSLEKDQRTVIARRVTPSGIQETLGSFDRGSTLGGAERGQAVRLGAGSIALITIETTASDPVQSSIVLRVIRNGEIATSRLAFEASGWASVAAAIGTNKQLAIVAAPFNDSGVVAVMVDPEQPNHPTTRPLTPAAVAVTFYGLRLTANGDRFIAGWIRSRDADVQIAEFDRRIVLPAVTIANHVTGLAPTIALGHAPGEDSRDVTIFWTDDRGNVMLRRLPEPPTGSVIASDLLRAFSDWAKGKARSVQDRP